MTTRVILERDVPVPMRDGTILMADVWRPDDDERYPVLVQRSPYDKTFFPFAWVTSDATKLAANGYAVVIQDQRGRGMSQGEFPLFEALQADDGADTIAWAADQPWSTGDVGMWGISNMAVMQWQAAAAQPPALKAIAPVQGADVRRRYLHRGGAFQLGHLAGTFGIFLVSDVVRSLIATPEKIPAALTELVDAIDAYDWRRLPLSPFCPQIAAVPTLGAYFEPQVEDLPPDDRPDADYERITTPALMVAGWSDFLLQHDLDHFVAMRARAGSDDARRLTRITIGPWAHAVLFPWVGERDFGIRAAGNAIDLREDLTGLHTRWFDARLKGIDTGIDDEPPVKLFVMGRNRWRTEDTWPLARARAQLWHLHADGTLSERPPEDAEPSVFALDPDDPVPTLGGNVAMATNFVRGPREQTRVEQHKDVLLFTSEPLSAELEVTGRVTLRAWVAAETVDSDVVARLCDVFPDGRSYHVADGILRLRFRRGLNDPAALTPGEPTEVAVDLWSTSYAFQPGHRIRLQICASDFPRYDRCPGTGESSAVAKQVVPQRNRVFHDPRYPSHLELPVVSP